MPLQLNWLPDETVFSLCSRYHRVSGHVVAHQTTRDIFQHHQIGSAHDLPPRLEYFAHRFDFRLGAAAEVAAEHTILPFFYGLRSPEFAQSAIDYLCSKDAAHLKYRLGLLTCNQGAMHPLKVCPACMKEDISAHNISYWHLSHQLPGSAVCLKHQATLLVAKDKTFWFKRFQWVLPDEAEFENIEPTDPAALITCLELQAFIEQYFEHTKQHQFFDPQKIGQACQHRLKTKGFVTANGSYRWEKLTHSFQSWLSGLRHQNHIYYLPKTDAQASRFVAQTIRGVRYGRANHPLNTLIVIAWLFSKWEDFAATYDQPAPQECLPVNPHEKPDTDANEKLRTKVINAIQKGASARQAALEVGVSTNTAVNWARAAGLHIQPRAKSAKSQALESAKIQLRRGKSKPSIERYTGLSRPTINRMLRDNPDLNEQWITTLHKRKFQLHKKLWDRTVSLNPNLSTKTLRLISPRSYAWLYRNERTWLLAKTKATHTSTNQTNQEVNWQQRDLLYANLVHIAAESLLSRSPLPHISRHELLRKVPEVARKQKHYDQLPLTKQALNEALLSDETSLQTKFKKQ